MKYFILPLGCQMNLSDSERIRTILESMGFKKTENEEDADLLGIISCSVRQKSIDRVYSKIKKWNDWKDSKNIITFVSGCILLSDEKKFLKLFDLLFRMNELKDLPELIGQYGINTPQGGIFQDQENFSQLEEFWDVKPHYTSSFEAFVPFKMAVINSVHSALYPIQGEEKYRGQVARFSAR